MTPTSPPPDTVHAAVALRLLLDDPRLDLDDIDWTELRRVGERGAVLVRLSEAVRRRGETPPTALAEQAALARGRTERCLQLVRHLESACRVVGLPHAFLKIAERYPDFGSDIDLLIPVHGLTSDPLLLSRLPEPLTACPLKRGLRGRLTAATSYLIGDAVLDLHHGRLGVFGEQEHLPQVLLRRTRSVTCGEVDLQAPSPEDHLLLIALHQVYTRPACRLADVYWTLKTLREPAAIAWVYVEAAARWLGLGPAVASYLRYVDGIHQDLFHQKIVTGEILGRLDQATADALPTADYRFPQTAESGRIYLQQFRAALMAHDWRSAARLSMLPVVAAAAASTPRRV